MYNEKITANIYCCVSFQIINHIGVNATLIIMRNVPVQGNLIIDRKRSYANLEFLEKMNRYLKD